MDIILSNEEANACYPAIHSEEVQISFDPQGDIVISPVKRKLQKCQICDTPTLFRCHKCRRMAYCCKEHQSSDWKRHRGLECKQIYNKYQHYLSARRNALSPIASLPDIREAEKIETSFQYVFADEPDDLGYLEKNHQIVIPKEDLGKANHSSLAAVVPNSIQRITEVIDNIKII